MLKMSIQRDVMNARCNLEVVHKKNHCFLVHREQQVGGAINQQLPLNILKRGVITYYSINHFQHKNYYDFFDARKLLIAF